MVAPEFIQGRRLKRRLARADAVGTDALVRSLRSYRGLFLSI